jgi:tetratricopeptide (TPR) repeat protein
MLNNNIKKAMFICASVLILWLLLIIKIAPAYIAGDSPETIMAFDFLGIQHPPGYALDTLIGKIFLFIPVGNLMFRSAMMAMFFNFMTALTIFRITLIVFKENNKKTGIYYAPAMAALFYLFSNDVFIQGMTAKGSVYTMHCFIMALIFLLLLEIKQGAKSLYLASFLFGLSLGNHWQSSVVLLPAMALGILLSGQKVKLKTWLKCLLFFLIGISIFAYLLLRQTTLIWSNVTDLNNLIWFLGRAPYVKLEHHHAFSIIDSFRLFKYYFSDILPGQYPVFLAYILFPGAAFLAWKLPKYGYFFIAAFICYLAGILLVSTEAGKEWVDKQFIIYVIFASVFISYFFDRMFNLIKYNKTTISILFAVIFPLLYINLPDYSRYFVSYDYVNNLVSGLPKGCLFFTEGDINFFGAYYKQLIDKNDINTIAVALLNFQWYREQVRRNSRGSISIPGKAGASDLAGDIKNVMGGNKDKEIYTSNFSNNGLLGYNKVPMGIKNKILIGGEQPGGDPYLPYKSYSYRGIFENRIKYDDFSEMLVLSTYERCLALSGDNLADKGDFDRALFFYNRAHLFFKEENLATNMAICYLQKGDAVKSEEYLDEAIRLNPEFAAAYYYKAAVAYMLLKDLARTKKNLSKVLELDKNNGEAKSLLDKLNGGAQ